MNARDLDTEKACTRCTRRLALDNFYVTKGRIQSWCKACMNEHTRKANAKPVVTTRKCRKCGQEKPLQAFQTDPRRKPTSCTRCVDCKRADNVERLRKKRQEKAAAEGRQLRERKRRSQDERRQHRIEQQRAARLKAAHAQLRHPSKGTFALHDAHVKARRSRLDRITRLPHDAHVRAFRSYLSRSPAMKFRHRMANDPGFRLNVRLRVAIRKALKGMKRGRSWEEFVDYSLDELVQHFTRQLPKKKTLHECLTDGWHIDHITPKSTFNLADPSDLRAAWALPNLRLIPPKENMRKGSKREFLL